jgi:hypothetical protein
MLPIDYTFFSRASQPCRNGRTRREALNESSLSALLGPVNTCFAPTTMTDFSRNKARAAQQSKLCKRQVTTGRVKFRPVPKGCAQKNAGAALQSLAIGPLCPALRALPSRFFAQQRGRETSVNRP